MGLRLLKKCPTMATPCPSFLTTQFKMQNVAIRKLRDGARQSQSEGEVNVDSIGEVGIITLNRPQALNALNYSMVEKICEQLLEWQKSKKQFVIIKGRVFCAGADIREISHKISTKQNYTSTLQMQYTLGYVLYKLKMPTIVLMHGLTMGLGLTLGIHSSYGVATENCIGAIPENDIGVIPHVGLPYFLSRLPESVGGKAMGMFLGLTGHQMSGSDLYQLGFATYMCPSSHLQNLMENLICIQNSSSSCLQIEIQKILQHHTKNLVDSNKECNFKNKMALIHIFGLDSVEKIIHGLEQEGSDWSMKVVHNLNKLAPTSLKITHKLINRAHNLTLRNCLKMEYRVALRCCEAPDFCEGVRSVLIDKDDKPNWTPGSLADVTDEIVQSYFEPLSQDMKN